LVQHLHCSHSSSSPFLKWLWQVSIFHIHTCVGNTSTTFILLYPPPPVSTTSLTILSFVVKVFVHYSVWFYLGILPINYLFFYLLTYLLTHSAISRLGGTKRCLQNSFFFFL
jgi:hypothetical protein